MNIEDIKSKYPYFFTESTVIFCGQGWIKILDQLFDQITAHIHATERNYKSNINYNQMVEKCQHGDWTAFDQYYYNWDAVSKEKFKNKIIVNGARVINPICSKITINKIDEHAGHLTIDYSGGDQTVHGMVLLDRKSVV